MANYRKQHILPSLSLKHFTDFNGHVWTYDKDEGKNWHRVPDETGVISHFYSYEMPDGSLNTDFEETLNKIETAAAPAYCKLLEEGRLSEDERWAFSEFLGAMYVRTASMRRVAARLYALDLHTHLVAQTISKSAFEAKVRRTFGDKYNPELPEYIRKEISDLTGYTLTVPKEATLSIMGIGSELAILF